VNVRGKTILVTGAGRGIGRSLAMHFAGKGANLALLDVNADDVNETRSCCTQLGIEARSYIADAAKRGQRGGRARSGDRRFRSSRWSHQ
jgi:3-oxoacyl-[acyl-carrier protein] reductase